MAEYRRDWNGANRAAARAHRKKWRTENPEQVRELKRRSYQANLERARERQRAWRQANPEKVEERNRRRREKHRAEGLYLVYRLRSKYGLSTDDVRAMVAAQDNRCPICGRGFDDDGVRVHIDHDHATSAVRGLLCQPCNQALGFMEDDPARCDAAAAYLRARSDA